MPTIQINYDYFVQLGTLPFPLMLARLFLDGGWLPILAVLAYGAWLLWVQSRQAKYAKSISYVLLAIDVPRLNEQTPKAVEHIFSHISGAYSGLDRIEKYWFGKFQPTFSFELISIEGYVQFLVRMPKKFRDLVEASVYAQYPDAEITEVADYTDKVPSTYPNAEWDAFGSEFILKKPSPYPIRTYVDFEHQAAEVMTFKDPMSPILETFAQLKRGEQLWLQWLVTPTDDSWRKAGEAIVNKTLGKKVAPKKSFVGELLELPIHAIGELTTIGAPAGDKKKTGDATPRMVTMSPGERKALEAMENKLSKIGFRVKMRTVYIGKRDVFSKGRYVAVKGALAQFAVLNMNGFRGYAPVTPKGDYFWQKWSENAKKSAIVRNFRNRSGNGAPAYILNIEELATVYHFPSKDVKAPLVKKTEAKRSEPPSSLPTEDRFPRMSAPPS